MLTGKTALITGSTSGIGLAIAERLAASGANLVINGLVLKPEHREAALALRDDLARRHGVEVVFSDADLTRTEAIEAMMAMTQERFGGADILVNNAGMQHVSPIEDFPPARWDMILALNLTAAFHTIRLSMAGMKARGWGRIINTASAHALVASPFKSAYVAAKHGMAGLTKTVALEGAVHGVRCNAVCPGYVFTPLVENQIADTAKARNMSEDEVRNTVLLAAQPTKEFVTVEQVAGFVRFLCSPDADSINGAILSMDGGWVAQ